MISPWRGTEEEISWTRVQQSTAMKPSMATVTISGSSQKTGDVSNCEAFEVNGSSSRNGVRRMSSSRNAIGEEVTEAQPTVSPVLVTEFIVGNNDTKRVVCAKMYPNRSFDPRAAATALDSFRCYLVDT